MEHRSAILLQVCPTKVLVELEDGADAIRPIHWICFASHFRLIKASYQDATSPLGWTWEFVFGFRALQRMQGRVRQ